MLHQMTDNDLKSKCLTQILLLICIICILAGNYVIRVNAHLRHLFSDYDFLTEDYQINDGYDQIFVTHTPDFESVCQKYCPEKFRFRENDLSLLFSDFEKRFGKKTDYKIFCIRAADQAYEPEKSLCYGGITVVMSPDSKESLLLIARDFPFADTTDSGWERNITDKPFVYPFSRSFLIYEIVYALLSLLCLLLMFFIFRRWFYVTLTLSLLVSVLCFLISNFYAFVFVAMLFGIPGLIYHCMGIALIAGITKNLIKLRKLSMGNKNSDPGGKK